jgi:hypothetical protein
MLGLKFEDVVEAGLRARRTGEIPPSARRGRDSVCFEYLYDDGGVWLSVVDAIDRTVSMRAVSQSNVPRGGWRHDVSCRCRHCSS